MTDIAEEQLDILISLQGIEYESGRIKRVLGGVSRKVEERRERLTAFENGLAEKEAELAAKGAEARSLELEIETNSDRIKKSEEHLRTVTTNREYQVLLREIDENKKRGGKMEDTLLELLEALEEEEKAIGGLRAECVQLASQVKSEVEDIEADSIEERQELERITEKRDRIAENVAPDLLHRFNLILEQSRGVALVPVRKAVCSGCHMGIPPQVYNELHARNTLHYCPHCHRMLYYEKPEDSEE